MLAPYLHFSISNLLQFLSINPIRTRKETNMKRILTAAALTLLFSNLAFGYVTIKGSKHDFSSASAPNSNLQSNNQNQICVFCHTPHNAVKNVPLWNRSNPDPNSYHLYTSSASAVVSRGAKLQSDSISLFCLSCHDGAAGNIAASVINKAAPITGTFNWTTRAGSVNTTPANLTGDGAGNLANDHPIGFTYPASVSNNLYARATVTASFGKNVFYTAGGVTDQMECSSCHAVHDSANPPFLRTTNASSALCLTCHMK
jgi:predicted CXXCH cytochrome family protein